MSRLPMLPDTELTPAQQAVAEAIASGPRGGIRGPFPAMLRSPELASRVQALGEFLRFGTSLDPRLSELAICVTARQWSARYEWFAHARLARKAGVADATLDAIARRERPAGMPADEALIHDAVLELHTTRGLSDETYAKVVAAHGEHGLVELIALSGYYVMVAMTLNVADVPLPEGEPDPFPV